MRLKFKKYGRYSEDIGANKTKNEIEKIFKYSRDWDEIKKSWTLMPLLVYEEGDIIKEH